MGGSRRLSQAICEGGGISLIVRVDGAAAARAAEQEGAEAVASGADGGGLRDATALPLLCAEGTPEDARRAGADACLVVVEHVGDDAGDLETVAAEAHRLGLEVVVDVHDEEELELALERLDPEILLLSPRGGGDEPLDRVLSLLPDVPAGKLAIADLPVRTREQVIALERAGFDAVLVAGGDVRELAGLGPAGF